MAELFISVREAWAVQSREEVYLAEIQWLRLAFWLLQTTYQRSASIRSAS